MNETGSDVHQDLTIAWFDSMDRVREAELALERRGVDSVHIEVASASSVDDRRSIDRGTWSWAGSRAAVGALVGAAIGALVGLFAGLLLVDGGNEVWPYVLGVALFGFWAGFFYGFATRLPAGSDTLDTFADRTDAPGGENWIAVRGPEPVRRDAAAVLEGMDPSKLVPSG